MPQTMVDSRYCLDQFVPEGIRQVSRTGYLLALLRELSQCPRALTEIIMPKQVRKTNLHMFWVPFLKKGWKIDHHVSNLRTRGFLFQGVQVRGSSRIFGDSSVIIAQWWRARHSRKLVIRKAPGSIPAENTSPQIHMDLST